MEDKNQITISDLGIAVDNIPEKYIDYVRYNRSNNTPYIYYRGFNDISVADCIAVDNTVNTVNKSAFDVMLQVVKIRQHLMSADVKYSDNNLTCFTKSEEFYELMLSFYGFSKTFCKNIQRVYSMFFSKCSSAQLLKDFDKYTFNQLVEICSIPLEQFSALSPTMTIKQLRSFKKFINGNDKKLPKKSQSMLTDSVDNTEEKEEDSTESISISKSFLSSFLADLSIRLLEDVDYDPKTTSHKIYKKGVMNTCEKLINAFYENEPFNSVFKD